MLEITWKILHGSFASCSDKYNRLGYKSNDQQDPITISTTESNPMELL